MALNDLCAVWAERFWAAPDVHKALSRPGSVAFYAAEGEDEKVWDGFIFAELSNYNAELLYIYVRNEQRSCGVGKMLMKELIANLRGRSQMETLFLEVRRSNRRAQKFYEGFRMQEVGSRPGYYSDGEDALIYRMNFKETEASS
jgi:ribosomal-protein-alanine N-acetyltransferase